MRRLLITGSALLVSGASHSAAYICKQVGPDWQELSFHVLSSIEYVVVGPAGKQYEIGTGLWVFGRPRGTRDTGRGVTRITAFGVGGLYVRSIAGDEFKVCATSEGVSPITIINEQF